MTNSIGFPSGAPTANPTIIPFFKIGSQYYITNSAPLPTDEELIWCRPLSCATITLGVTVLVHSFFINKWKFPTVRILTDICAVGVCLTGLFQILSKILKNIDEKN